MTSDLWLAIPVDMLNLDYLKILKPTETIATMRKNGKYFSSGLTGWKAGIATKPNVMFFARILYPTREDAEQAARDKVNELKGKT